MELIGELMETPERRQTMSSLYRVLLLTLAIEVEVQFTDEQYLADYLEREVISGIGLQHVGIQAWYLGLSGEERDALHRKIFVLSKKGAGR